MDVCHVSYSHIAYIYIHIYIYMCVYMYIPGGGGAGASALRVEVHDGAEVVGPLVGLCGGIDGMDGVKGGCMVWFGLCGGVDGMDGVRGFAWYGMVGWSVSRVLKNKVWDRRRCWPLSWDGWDSVMGRSVGACGKCTFRLPTPTPPLSIHHTHIQTHKVI